MQEWFDTLKSLGFVAGNIGIVEMSKDSSLDLLPEDFPIFQRIESEIVDYFFAEFEKENPMYYIDIFRVLMRLLRKETFNYVSFDSVAYGIDRIRIRETGFEPAFHPLSIKVFSSEDTLHIVLKYDMRIYSEQFASKLTETYLEIIYRMAEECMQYSGSAEDRLRWKADSIKVCYCENR